MDTYIKKIEIRWADLDPNFHMLHSKYYDLGAYCRISFFVEQGITPAFMIANSFGPILFREECIFKKEIRFGDDLSINVNLTKATTDYARWSMIHEIRKNEGTVAAIISIDGAWLDTKKRKLRVPPPEVISAFEKFPKTPDFTLYTK